MSKKQLWKQRIAELVFPWLLVENISGHLIISNSLVAFPSARPMTIWICSVGGSISVLLGRVPFPWLPPVRFWHHPWDIQAPLFLQGKTSLKVMSYHFVDLGQQLCPQFHSSISPCIASYSLILRRSGSLVARESG